MSSRTWLLGWVCALAACGNYSNDDVEFLNALPHQQDLSAKIPQSTGGGLGDPDAGCNQALDTTSCFYTGTYAAAQNFNGVVGFMLGLVDAAETVPASSRTPDSRTWGPFPADNEPGFDAELVISRTPPDEYDYAIQFHRHTQPATDPWFPMVSGAFKASGGARKGTGALHLDAAGARSFGLTTPDLETVVALDTSVDTANIPTRVSIEISAASDGGTASLVYAYREYPPDGGSVDGGINAAALQYTLTLDPPGGTSLTMNIHSAWLASGAGQGNSIVTAGDQTKVGFSDTECWDGKPNFLTRFLQQTWPGGADAGDPSQCQDVSNL